MSTHTPGLRWIVDGRAHRDTVSVGDRPAFLIRQDWHDVKNGIRRCAPVALVPDYDDEDGLGDPPAVTVASLIAAAPELLEAAKHALLGMDGGDNGSRCHAGITTRDKCPQCRRKDGLRAAIAKAEGR